MSPSWPAKKILSKIGVNLFEHTGTSLLVVFFFYFIPCTLPKVELSHILYINSRSACVRLSDTTFCTGNLRGRFCNPSLCPFVHLSVCSSVCPSVRPFVRLSVRSSVYPDVCLSCRVG
jgi:hypothetical protein